MTAASPLPIPARCPSCGHAPPPPVSPEVARWHDTAAGLFREARAASGSPQIAMVLRKRAISALTRAIEAQVDVEMAAGRT